MDSSTIRVLYENVLHDDVKANRIKDNAIRKAINNMKEVYKPDPTSLQSDVVEVADYNDVVHRCAYLHKYAPLHTALVSEMLQLAMNHNAHIFQAIVNKHGCFNVCSLGGGPGSDVIAVLDILHRVLGYFQVNATIVDIMVGWKYTFESILRELQEGDYGLLSEHVSEQYFNWSYEGANLLSKMTTGAHKAIASANLITMVKFVSASSCKDTSAMIGEIFRSMKAGAMVLFIDNDGGSYYRTAKTEAQFCNFEELFLREHFHYSNETFKVKKRVLQLPCHETKVTACLWRKPRFSFKQNRKLNPPTTSSGVRVVNEEIFLRNVPMSSINPIPAFRTSNNKIKQKRDRSYIPLTFPVLPQQGYSVIPRFPSRNSTNTSRNILSPFVLTTREKNPSQSARIRAGYFLLNQNGSSSQSVDRRSRLRRFVTGTGKVVLFLCNSTARYVMLPLGKFCLSQIRPNNDTLAVRENNGVIATPLSNINPIPNLPNRNGSSSQSMDERSRLRRFVNVTGKVVLFLCNSTARYVILPLWKFFLSRIRPNNNTLAVRENNGVATPLSSLNSIPNLPNQNGSSPECRKGRQFATETGKELFWFLCKKVISHVLLPLVDLILSQYHPNDDVLEVAANNDVGEYFFEHFPSNWN